jgi:2-amino-4-hydroxy-6-hydroxymethyldihydropteridine diphosphokinase
MIGLGSNLEDPARQIRQAVKEIGALAHCRLIAVSSLYESAPIGGVEQPAFVNAVAQVETSLTPGQLMASLLAIEIAHDRVRTIKNGPRTLDLDILLFDDRHIDEPNIVAPHPRAHERAFVLLPLLELDPELYIPGKGMARDFVNSVSDQMVRKLAEHESGLHR